MTVSKPVVVARLAHLGTVIRDLERLRALPRNARETDAIANLALERALHIAAEAIFDIGHHILAGRGLDVPARYREVLPALARAGIIDTALLGRLEPGRPADARAPRSVSSPRGCRRDCLPRSRGRDQPAG